MVTPRRAWRCIALIAGASLAHAFQIFPAVRLSARAGALSSWAYCGRAGGLLRSASRQDFPVRNMWRERSCLRQVITAVGNGAESASDAEELKTGVQLRTPDVDKLCAWLTEEITLWLDQDWIERDVHRAMGERASASVRQMVETGNLGVSAILFAVAEDLGAANFPRLFESDVNEWDVANKVSDLLLQSMRIDVCCTTAPLTGLPDYQAVESATVGAPVETTNSFQAPESSMDKYLFLQRSLDGRIHVKDLNAAVLLTLSAKDVADMGVLDRSALDFFADDIKAIEDLDDALQAKLKETNKRDSDLDPLLEALYGEEMLATERSRGDPEFIRRETCVKWLHVAGGY